MGTFVPTTAAEREQMLRTIGVSSVEDLFRDVPQQMYLDGYLDLPPGRSELETLEAVSALAERNRVFKTCLRGAGSYRHYIPAAVKAVVTREEFVTAYTPYQAEISQGILQGIFEYQTMLCELTAWTCPMRAFMTAELPPQRPSPCAATANAQRPTSPQRSTRTSSAL